MIALTFAAVVATCFFLAFASVRWVGILGLAFLIYVFPLSTVGLLSLGSLFFFFCKLR